MKIICPTCGNNKCEIKKQISYTINPPIHEDTYKCKCGVEFIHKYGELYEEEIIEIESIPLIGLHKYIPNTNEFYTWEYNKWVKVGD